MDNISKGLVTIMIIIVVIIGIMVFVPRRVAYSTSTLWLRQSAAAYPAVHTSRVRIAPATTRTISERYYYSSGSTRYYPDETRVYHYSN